MAQLSVNLPQQRKTYSEKKRDNFKWARDCVDAISVRMYQYNSDDNTYHTDVERKLTNYKLYNNILDQADFEKDCNPFGLTAEEFKDNVQPHNKLPNKINVLLGEELKRPFNFRACLINDQAVNAYTRAKKTLQKDYIQSKIDAELNKFRQELLSSMEEPQSEEDTQKLNEEIEAEVSRVLSPEQIEKYMATEWRDGVEIMVDQLLQWFNKRLNIRRKKNDGFKHACISGEEHAWVGVVNGEPVIELLNPIKLFYHKSSEVEFIQDGAYAGYRTKMTPSDILDRFGDDLSDVDKEKIDSINANTNLYGITDNILNKEINLEGLK